MRRRQALRYLMFVQPRGTSRYRLEGQALSFEKPTMRQFVIFQLRPTLCFAGLRELNLSYGNLSGTIPSSLGSCVKLTMLNISHNKLEGEDR